LLNLDSKLTSGRKDEDDWAVAGGEERLSVDVYDGEDSRSMSFRNQSRRHRRRRDQREP
jgi:hypothetical protein